MTLSIDIALGQFLPLVVVSLHLCTNSGFGIRNLIDIHVNHVVAAHLGGHGEVADDDVLLLLHIVIIAQTIGVVIFAIIAVLLVIVALAVPIICLHNIIVHHGFLHLLGSKGVVGRAEIKAQLVHRARFHINIIRKHDGESLPLVGIRIVDGEAHFLFQSTRFANIVSLIKFILLQERKNVVIENTYNSQCHRVEADSIEINGGFVHIGDDDAIIGPTHLGQVVGQVEIKWIVALQQHAIGGADATTHRHLQFRKLVVIQGGLVEIEINLITLNVSLVAKLLIEIDETGKVLVLLQGLREEQCALAARLVNVKHHRYKVILGKHR